MSVPLEIRSGRRPGYPAGPSLARSIGSGRAFRENSAEFMLRTAREFGDLNYYRAFGREIYQLNHPDLLVDFFGRDAPRHHRNLVMQRSRDVLGTGLLTSEEPQHMRQRRLAQPAFLRERIGAYAEVIGAQTLTMLQEWPTATGELDVHPEMLELALRIVGKCLFDLDELEDVSAMASAVDSFMSFVPLSFLPFSQAIQALPLPAMRRLRQGKVYLDGLIYGMIAERRADPRDRGDLLSMLLQATDPEGQDGGSAAGMDDRQLRDECVTIILAGHETTANALSFALHLLALHPEAQARVRAEASAVLGERAPGASDFPRLGYATQVFAEAMRLYPPVWVTGRTCAESYEIAGFRIPVGATLLAPQFAIQRDARFFADPAEFDPGRFTAEAKAGRPRYSYFPFGGGSRQCIAEGLAWMEGTLVLAVIVREFELSLAPGQPREPVLKPAVSLRPGRGIPLRVRRCGAASTA